MTKYSRSTLSRTFTFAVVAATSAASLAACGGKAPTNAASDSGLSVGLFVANSFGDHSYYDAAKGAIPALENTYDATVTTYEGKLETQNYGPLLQDAADRNELVYVVGNQAIDATIEAAAQNPDTTFVFVNGVARSKDVVSVTYRYAESCYVGGTLAAHLSQEAGKDTIGWIGGFEAPPMADCEAGYGQGATDVDPDLKLVSRYVGSFSDPAKGLETATAEAQDGAYVIYASAGLSSQGVVQAAMSGTAIAPILAASPKVPPVSPAVVNDHTDVLILDAAERFSAGELPKGEVKTFGFKEGAFDIQFNDKLVDAAMQAEITKVIESIKAGSVKPQGAS